MIRRIAGTIGIAASLLFASGAWGKVTVDRESQVVKHVTFDPRDPPKGVHLGGGESAVTVSEFDLKIGLSIDQGPQRRLPNGRCQQSFTISGAQLKLGLGITIYLPSDANAKLKAHEEGHRAMAEKIYRDDALKSAEAAGALIDHQTFTVEAANWDGIGAALTEAIKPVYKKAYDAYLSHTADIGAEAGDYYDEITRHGARLDIDEKTAADQAFARVAAKHADARPATRPTTRQSAR